MTLTKTCCKDMDYYSNSACVDHGDWCPDFMVHRNPDGNYGLKVFDGGHSYILIEFCPWCGTKLFERKRLVPEIKPTISRAEDLG